MTDSTHLDRLRSDLGGTLVLAGDPDYDTARLAWNLAVDQRPAAIATPADVADVQAIVRAAREGGYGVTTQPNGHGADGDLSGVILIRPSRFDEITVDLESPLLRVGAGVNWGRVLEQPRRHRAHRPGGSNPEVNVVGLALNGGQSMFSRRYGLTARSIIAVELVDAEGSLPRHRRRRCRPHLGAARRRRAVRRGHRHRVVAVSRESLFGGSLAFPARPPTTSSPPRSSWHATSPSSDSTSAWSGSPTCRAAAAAARPDPRDRRLVHLGDEDTARSYADRLIAVAEPVANTLTPFTIGSLAAVAAEPVDPMPSADFGGSIDRLDETFAREFVDAFLAGADLGLMRCSVRALGGAIADELGAESSAVGAVQAGGFSTRASCCSTRRSTRSRAAAAARPRGAASGATAPCRPSSARGRRSPTPTPPRSSTASRRSSGESIPRGSSAATGR